MQRFLYIVVLWETVLACTISLNAQNKIQEKRIYVVDVTASMEGKGIIKTPNIFQEVKSNLIKTISDIKDTATEVVIIPFTDRPHQRIRNFITHKSDSILPKVNSLKIMRGDTNIADAWSASLEELDSTKVNYIFLLTDGLHNDGPEKDVLYQRLYNWGSISQNKYFFAFYVMLTPNAHEQEICDIVDITKQMWLIESMDVNVTFLFSKMSLQANYRNSKEVRIYYDSNYPQVFDSDIEFELQLNENPYYSIDNIEKNWNEHYISFNLKELQPTIRTPIAVPLELHVYYDKEKYPMIFFTPDNYHLNVVNKGIRELNLKVK